MGDMLRRYWWPVAVADDLKEQPTLIRVMGEDLVLFRDRRGRVGLIGARCAHRRANLCLGTAALEGLRCRYHGWLYDTLGKVLDTPGVATDKAFKDAIQQPAYPVQEMGGLIFAYLGPLPVPLLPRFDFLVGPGERVVKVVGFADCNWLQLAENGVDPLHVTFAHASTWTGVSSAPVHMSFDETDLGLIYRAGRPIDKRDRYAYREQHWLFPGVTLASEGYGRMTSNDISEFEGKHMLLPKGARYNVPIDDTHSMVIRVIWLPEGTPARYAEPLLQEPDWRQAEVEPYLEYRKMQGTTRLGYDWPVAVSAQDATIIDNMGPLSDRENEHLTSSDDGIVIVRKLLRDALVAVTNGQDPKGVMRDEARNSMIEIWRSEQILARADFERVVQRNEAAE